MSAQRSSNSRRLSHKRELAEDIVRKPEIVLEFYHIMKLAAKHAVTNTTNLVREMFYEVLSTNKKGVERGNKLSYSADYSLEYNSNDIYVYGGCALALYDGALRGLKEKHNLNALENRVLKNTTDIDLAWFPRVPDVSRNQIATSRSPVIMTMIEECKIDLEKIVVDRQKSIEKLIREKLKDRHEIMTVNHFVVDHEHIVKAGVHSIKISCDVNGITLQLCEMAIHDSGSSQLFDKNHKKITTLRPMTEDPVYCSPNELVHLDIHDKEISVPNLTLYCKQQLFIVGNLLRSEHYRTPNQIVLDNQKALGSFYRVAFVLYLLEPLRQNQRNVSERINVENVSHTINEIHEMANHLKRVFHTEIQSLCSIKMQDEVRALLCGPLKQIKGLSSYAMYSHNVATKKRQNNRNVAYEILNTLKKSSNHLNIAIYRLMETITSNTPMNASSDLLQLQRDAFELHDEVMQEFNNPSKNHRNLYEKVEELNDEIKKLYDKYYEIVDTLDIQSLRIVSASAAQPAALPPRHPSMSHLSASRSIRTSNNNTRKNGNNAKKN